MPEHDGLVSTAELAGILDQPDLRLFDCTTYLEYLPEGSGIPYIAVPGRHTFEAAHIPGADFLDLQGEFSDQSTELRFMMPAIAQLEAAFGRHGIAANSRVVLYSIGTAMWATRFWWMLRSLGFENVSVLDGGLDKWKAESRAIETGPAKGYPPATFIAKPQRGYFVDKKEVLTAGTDHNTVVVNALAPQFYNGLEPGRYGRPGAFPAASMFPQQRCSIRRPRPSFRLRKQRRNLPRKASARTSAWSPIAAAASRPPSTCFCCTASATTTSPFTTVRWGSGRRMHRCRSRPAKP